MSERVPCWNLGPELLIPSRWALGFSCPSGVLIPVSDRSRRFSTGIVQVLVSPRKLQLLVISRISFSYVIPTGQCLAGLSMMVVSYMSRGALSVRCPSVRDSEHVSTSGKRLQHTIL